MAVSSLLALIDDIASILDDVAILAKLAAKKTTGVLGDDLALNAQQLIGLKANRELPVVWAVAKGSLLNKAILVPSALIISAFAPWAITPILMLGGLFLCFEGFEKVAHRFLHDPAQDKVHHTEHLNALADPKVDLVQLEKDKIEGAVRTDLILSAEIIAISLGTVAGSGLLSQTLVLSIIAIAMTIGVYGFVAAIVKLDDLGLYLVGSAGEEEVRTLRQRLGFAILWFAPWLMKTLSVLGTAAMFLVGGGIISHGIGFLHHAKEAWAHGFAQLFASFGSDVTGWVEAIGQSFFDLGLGLVCGALVLLLVKPAQRVFSTETTRQSKS